MIFIIHENDPDPYINRTTIQNEYIKIETKTVIWYLVCHSEATISDDCIPINPIVLIKPGKEYSDMLLQLSNEAKESIHM